MYLSISYLKFLYFIFCIVFFPLLYYCMCVVIVVIVPLLIELMPA